MNYRYFAIHYVDIFKENVRRLDAYRTSAELNEIFMKVVVEN